MDNEALEAATKTTTAAAATAAAAVSSASAIEATAPSKSETATTTTNNNNTIKVTTASNGIKENNSSFSTTATTPATATTPIIVTSGIVATPVKSEANKTDKDSTPPRDAPPLTPLTKGLNLTGTPLVRKEKRQSSTRYNVSKNCELTPLSTLNESAININCANKRKTIRKINLNSVAFFLLTIVPVCCCWLFVCLFVQCFDCYSGVAQLANARIKPKCAAIKPSAALM
ncbi:serine-rich adhesin for platelets-like, partial [Drosophila mojavensis]|uniref:serine-rich adhesin for platelets-like n=1 Tax=Drosophila mojavensis TaxID=7230 RepID=UPI001CD106F5